MKKAFALMAMMSAALVVGCAHEHDEQEVTVSLNEVPTAVRETFVREAPGGEVVKVEKETDDGRTSYEAWVKVNGEMWEIETDANGKLLEKKRVNK